MPALEDISGVQQARDAGYSDDEIYSHLASGRPEFAKAKEAGYSFNEVYQHMHASAQEQAKGMQESALGITSPIGGMLAGLRGDLQAPLEVETRPGVLKAHTPEITKTDTPMDALKEGRIGDFFSQSLESVSQKLSPLLGPTEKQKISEAVPTARGYEFKPEGGYATQHGLIPALFEAAAPMNQARGLTLAMEGKPSDLEAIQQDFAKAHLAHDAKDTTSKAIGKAVYNNLLDAAQNFTNPVFLAMPESKLISSYFAADMLKTGAKQAFEASDSSKTVGERVEKGIGALLSLSMGGLATSHALPEGAPVVPTLPATESLRIIATVPKQSLEAALQEPELASHLHPEVRKMITDELGRREQQEGPKPPVDPEFLDGLHVARNTLTKDFDNQTPEVQQKRQEQIDEIDDQLLRHDRSAVNESAARTATPGKLIERPVPPIEKGGQASPPEQPSEIERIKQELRSNAAPQTAEALQSSPPPSVEPPASGQPAAPIAEQERAPATETPPATEAEGVKIAGPALLDAEGKPIITGEIGETHQQLKAKAIAEARKNGDVEAELAAIESEHGFVDDQGTAHDRNSGWDLAKKAGQVPEDTVRAVETLAESGGSKPELHSDHLIREEAAPAAEPTKTFDDAHAAALKASQQIADDVARGQPDTVREAARDAAYQHAANSITEENPQFNPDLMRKEAMRAAGKAAGKQMESLDVPAGEGGRTPLEETPSEQLTPDQEAAKTEYVNKAQEVMGGLDQREQEVLTRSVMGRESLEDVGKSLGITKQRVQQIRDSALEKMRTQMELEGYMGGPGAMGPVEALEAAHGQTKTGTKNAIVDAERAARGLPPVMARARQALGEVWDAAMKIIDRNPDAGRDLVHSIIDNPRAVTATEEATLLHHKIDVMNELDNATRHALDEEESPAVRQEEQGRAARLLDELNDIDHATKLAGSEWGRTGRFRQQLIAEDYSLAKMVQRKQMAKGEKLTPEETANVAKMSKRIEELEGKLSEHEKAAEAEREKVKEEAFSKAVEAMKAKETPADQYAKSLIERIKDGLKSQADKARERIRQRLGAASAGIDPTVVYDVAVIGAEKLFSVGLDFAKWTAEMVKDLGESIRPYLTDETFQQSQKINNDAIDALAPKKDGAKVRKEMSREERAIEGLKRNKDKPEAVGKWIQQIAENFVRKGVVERDALVDSVHDAVKEILPNASKRDIRDGISGYGDFRELSKDEVKVKLRDLKGQMQQVSKLEDMLEKGKLPSKTGVERRVPSAEERALAKEVNWVKQELGLEATDPNQLKSAMDAVKTRLRNRIEDLQRAIEKGEKIPKKEKTLVDDAEASELRSQKDQLQEEYDAIFSDPKLTPEQIALKVYKTRITKRIADLNDRVKRGDFSKTPRKQVELDAEGLKLKAEAEKAKLEFDRALYRDTQARKPMWERGLELFPKISRAFILSNPVTLAKLVAAAAWRMAITPLEETIGLGLKQLPLVSAIAERAPREGGGLNVRAESRALTRGLIKGAKDSYDMLTKGETELDTVSGKRKVIPHEWYDVFGHIHGALKSVTKRNEFERSLQQRMEFNMANGVDVTDPMVQTRLMVEAYKDAQRSIFQQDNFIVSRFNRFVRSLEEPKKETGTPSVTGKATAAALKTLLPIVKIPTNIVAEAFQYAAGSAVGSARLVNAFRSGIENLKPEQADLIMRELKKGSLGGALIVLGYFAPEVIGGYYQAGKKREEGDVKAGGVRFMGHDVPSNLLHNPAVEQVQIGATIRRVADSKLRKRDTDPQGVGVGVLAAGLGLTEEVPFIREQIELAKLYNPYQRTQFLGELARSRLEPQLIQWVAQQMDKDESGEVVKREPKNIVEYMESGIPGLRKNVPEKEPPKAKKKKRR